MLTKSPEGLAFLLSVPGVGAKTALRLAEGFATTHDVCSADASALRAVAGARAASVDFREASLPPPDYLRGAVTPWDDAYPPMLHAIDDPPPLLWIRGEPEVLSEPAGAVVGTRSPTAFGERVAARAAQVLASLDMVVVSGLALGVDAIAHRAALEHDAPTVAVLGSGVDRPTPKQHRGLADEIVENGGALVSELPPTSGQSPGSLTSRNRLQTGLSLLTVIAQCGLSSGTLHTAAAALLQQRPLVVPQPRGRHRDQAAGNLALGKSPAEPDVLPVSARVRDRLRGRSRLADYVPTDMDELADAIRTALRGDGGATSEPIQPSLL